MIKRSRSTHRHNFSDGDSVATQAVATANLVSMLDPAKVDADGVELIAEATGTKEEFVENLTNLVDEANEAAATIDEVEVIQNYSNKVRGLVETAKCRKNFSEDESDEDKIVDATAIVSMVDGEAFDMCASEEIAETISAATGAPEEAVEAIVELAKENFSAGMKYATAKARKLNRQNFAHLNFEDADKPVVAPATPAAKPYADDPVVDSALPKTGSEGLKQNPELAANDPTPANVIDNLSAADAGEAMAVQNELATIQGVAGVPDAANNFSRSQHQSNQNGGCSILQSLLGNDYVK